MSALFFRQSVSSLNALAKPFALLLVLLSCNLQSLAAHAATDKEIVEARIPVLAASLKNEHPRLLLRPADIPALREFLLKTLPAQTDGAALARLAVAPLDNKPLPPQPAAVKNGTQSGSEAWRQGYMVANDTGNWAWRYALGYQLTGEERYGREAARWLMHLASWKIDRDVLHTNDELFIQHLRPMIFAYDWAWAALTAEERATVSAAIAARLTLLAEHVQPKFALTTPTSPDNSLSHPMRFISTLGLGGLALYHDTAAAPAWVAWSYEYYQRQFPVWGGDAGGWSEGLNYWATGMTQHLRFLEAMKLQGFDEPLQRPFFRNTPWFAAYNLMPYPASSFGDLTNIMGPTPSIALMLEKFALLQQDPYLLRFGHLLTSKYPTAFSYYDFGAMDAMLHLFRRSQSKLQEAELTQLPQTRYFNDIGWVAMHSRLGNKDSDIMLAFKSSPYGSASHSFADQNSFVINAFGEPLAISSGYREWYDSPHHVGWTRTTAAKNAILIDGQGQQIKSATATGRVSREISGDRFSFVTGDAKAAYAGLATKALRHIFFVDRRYFVMLDEVAAPQESKFQWLLHAREEMGLDPDNNRIAMAKGIARLDTLLLSPPPGQLSLKQTDSFTPPVASGYEKRMPNEWHVTAETLKKSKEQNFFSVMYPHRDGYSAEDATIRTIKASRGYAVGIKTQDADDVVFMATENDAVIRAENININGLAGSVSTRGSDTRINLIEARRYDSRLFSFDSDEPLSLEATVTPETINIRFAPHKATQLTIQKSTSVRTVRGISKDNWDYDVNKRQITIKLPAQTADITIVPLIGGLDRGPSSPGN
ncbi:heparinase II/III family protein [Uliginosibacterium sp. H3]|uniref:Heparinase II/III family protein n=1 Tax=Uliginosibacterium silvisoli TaxID=3114758 RepID=A0ABU6KB59_9RHOO|nr:heparinase II/III family protein [Uliginosibacterium sp. H3]